MANFRKIGTDFSGGVRAAHYTNGRLLTAEDLRQDQQAVLARLAALGQSTGPGIVEGFEVTAVSGSNLQITAGLGVNGEGTVVELATAGPVILPVQPVITEDEPLRRAGRFEACLGDAGPGTTPLDSGAYLLTAAPLARLEGAVPRRTCDGTETSTCANQWEVEGVEFKIIRLTGYKPPAANRAGRNRNLLAHWFYGSDRLADLMIDPFRFDPAYTGFARISAEDLTPCDLPLAAFYWQNGQIAFVDTWAVRRRPGPPYPAAVWTANISNRRVAEGEARFLQFQEQLAALQSTQGAATRNVRATDHFAYLPPAAFLPVNPFELVVVDLFQAWFMKLSGGQRERVEALGLQKILDRLRAGVRATYGNTRVFDLDTFFAGRLPARYSIVHEDDVHNRLHQSWVQAPIQVPLPAGLSTSVFELIAADSTATMVGADNFAGILAGWQQRTATSLATAGNLSFMATPSALTARRSWEVVFPWDAGEDQQREPLVDIWVIDELLDPYRSRLAEEIDGRIDAAIDALTTGGGGTFTTGNQFAAMNTAVAKEFLLNNFLLEAANIGVARTTDLFQKLSAARAPIFYVMFVRHRPPVTQRPLQLPVEQ